jgi:hypothetical protein
LSGSFFSDDVSGFFVDDASFAPEDAEESDDPDDDSDPAPSSAKAVGALAIAAPIPSATANAPTRPTCLLGIAPPS